MFLSKDLEYEAPGSVRLRRDAWRVVKPPPEALGVVPYNPPVGPKGGDASKQNKLPDEPLSPTISKTPPLAAAANGATKADKAKEAKEAAAKKKAAKKRGSILAVKATPAAVPLKEEAPDLGPPGLREDRYAENN